MRTDTFLKHTIHPEERDRLAGRYGFTLSSDPSDAEADALALQGRQRVRLNPSATVGRRAGVCWVTPTPHARALLNASDAATGMRDRLGLIHHDAGRSLLALHLPGGEVAQAGATRPTFADAGSHTRFKTRADSLTNRRRYSWGHAADLERFANGAASIDGLAERVCTPPPGDGLGALYVTPLGRVTVTRGAKHAGTGRDDDAAFADRLCRDPGDPSSVRDRLLDLMEKA